VIDNSQKGLASPRRAIAEADDFPFISGTIVAARAVSAPAKGILVDDKNAKSDQGIQNCQ